VRAPITALLPPGLALPLRTRPTRLPYYGWLLLSALIGVATHILWDAFTDADFLPSRLLQYGSTALGLAVISWYLWQRRAQLRTNDPAAHHLSPRLRRLVVALLIAAPLPGAAMLARDDYDNYRAVTTSWTAVAEGVLTGAAKRAGAALAIAVLLYAVIWHVTTYRRRIETAIRPGNITRP
jgi:hypothetical protein